jgi:hypothetical protein
MVGTGPIMKFWRLSKAMDTKYSNYNYVVVADGLNEVLKAVMDAREEIPSVKVRAKLWDVGKALEAAIETTRKVAKQPKGAVEEG